MNSSIVASGSSLQGLQRHSISLKGRRYNPIPVGRTSVCRANASPATRSNPSSELLLQSSSPGKTTGTTGCSHKDKLQQEAAQSAMDVTFSSSAGDGVLSAALVLSLTTCIYLGLPESSQASSAHEQFQLAENQEFFSNVVRYGRYFVTVMLGTGYVMLRPLTSAFKNPVSAVLAIAGVVGGVFAVKLTLELMLGMSDGSFDYVQGQF